MQSRVYDLVKSYLICEREKYRGVVSSQYDLNTEPTPASAFDAEVVSTFNWLINRLTKLYYDGE